MPRLVLQSRIAMSASAAAKSARQVRRGMYRYLSSGGVVVL